MKIENILCTSMIAKKSEEETCLKICDSLFDKKWQPKPTSSQKNKVKDEDIQLSRIHPISEFQME